jgi:hypothetical protein
LLGLAVCSFTVAAVYPEQIVIPYG